MFLFNKSYYNKINILNILISIIPLSLILGNFVINLNIIFICLLGFFIYKKKIFYLKNKTYQYLIYFFFFYLILTTFLNNYPNLKENYLYKENLLKSFYFLRYLIFFLVLHECITQKHFNIKIFFISSAFFSFLLAVDIVIQVIFGKDLIGKEIFLEKPSGFFGEENIAGGYLQKFSLFFIFSVYLIFKKKTIYFFVAVFFFLLVIILTGNRMPLILFIFSFILFYLLEKKFKEIILFCFLFSSTIFIFLKFPFNDRFVTQTKLFYKNTIDIIQISPKLFYNNSYEKALPIYQYEYLYHFNSGVQIWKKNKFFGNGLKSFKIKCEYSMWNTCNNHPHNYFIQLMSDVGIIGLILIYLVIIFISIEFLRYYFINSKASVNKYYILPIFLIIIFEFFPVRSSGDFFSTGNATVIFLFLAIFINFKNLKN